MKKLAENWDLAVASGALLLIVGGLVAPRIRRSVSSAATQPQA
jgi:hypothetical protein